MKSWDDWGKNRFFPGNETFRLIFYQNSKFFYQKMKITSVSQRFPKFVSVDGSAAVSIETSEFLRPIRNHGPNLFKIFKIDLSIIGPIETGFIN